MRNQAKSIFLGITLGICMLCAFIALGILVTMGGQSVQRAQTLPAEIDAIGSQPPDAKSTQNAFPAQVGLYQLDTQKTVYDYYLDTDVDTAVYVGPGGEVALTLILVPAVAEAEDYVRLRKEWIDGNLEATHSPVDLPGKQLIIYDAPDQHGRIWNSQAWVIDIQATSEAARDDFFAALPYR